MKYTILVVSMLLLNSLLAQKVYFKTVNVKKANDSISAFVDANSGFSLKFSRNSYWDSRSDTTTDPNLYNSDLYLYQNDQGQSLAIFICPYRVSWPMEVNSEALKYFNLYYDELLKSKLRPDIRDAIIDSAYFKNLGIPITDSNYFFAARMLHRCNIIDGSTESLRMKLGAQSRTINFDQRLLDPDDFYYKYNSKLPLYTLILLVHNDWQHIASSVHLNMKLSVPDTLSDLDRINWILKQVKAKEKELNEDKEQLQKTK